jgi:hypothetical protein
MFSFMNALPAPIPAVLELFATSLSEVRFADLDGAVLARLAAEVEAAAAGVSAQQASLDQARATLAGKQEELMQRVLRAVAYARVYAETDTELAQRLDAIALPRASAPRAPRRLRPTAVEPVVVVEASAPPVADAVVTEVVADDVDADGAEAALPVRKGKRRAALSAVDS